MPRRPGPPSAVQLDTTPLPAIHLARDHAPDVVAARVRSGRWVRVRPGAYLAVDPDLPAHAARRVAGLARIAALGRQLRLEHTLSHESAALLWGLPLVTSRQVTHVIQGIKPHAGGPADIIRHVHVLPHDQRTSRLGLQTTTLERTVVDCAMALPPRAGMIIADAALHIGADRTACLAILDQMAGRRGVRRAREVLALADGGAESPGETTVRFLVLRAGLPVPTTQMPTVTHLGTFWSDLGWEEWGVVVEYDGVAKYGSNGNVAEAVLAEKRREDAIVEAGRRVIRVVAEDTRRSDELVRRIARLAPRGALDHLVARPFLAW